MSFDRLAPHYTWMEALLAGRLLQRTRTVWLDALAPCPRILIAGVGHGHFLRSCRARFPQAAITSVDASHGMLERAKRQVQAGSAPASGLSFVQAELPHWRPPAAHFDAIVTHFFLDCFPPDELAAVVTALAQAARPRARWLIADFTIPRRGLARHRARLVHAMMYAFFNRVAAVRARRVTDPAPFLAANGFAVVGRKSASWGLLQSDLWARSEAAL